MNKSAAIFALLLFAALQTPSVVVAQGYGYQPSQSHYWHGRPLGTRYGSGYTLRHGHTSTSSGWYIGGGQVWGRDFHGPFSTSSTWEDSFGNRRHTVTPRIEYGMDSYDGLGGSYTPRYRRR